MPPVALHHHYDQQRRVVAADVVDLQYPACLACHQIAIRQRRPTWEMTLVKTHPPPPPRPQQRRKCTRPVGAVRPVVVELLGSINRHHHIRRMSDHPMSTGLQPRIGLGLTAAVVAAAMRHHQYLAIHHRITITNFIIIIITRYHHHHHPTVGPESRIR